MRKLLIIDDDQGIIDVLTEEITREFAGIECLSVRAFDQAPARLEEVRPDAVVLDLLEGSLGGEPAGSRTWRVIWEAGRFCPVVIYTAFDGELTPPVPRTHPFVKVIAKGGGSEAQVLDALRSFQPLIVAVEGVHRELDLVLQRVLRDTAGAAVVPGGDPALLVHAARRRVAAMMDDKTAGEGRPLVSWELYLLPPLGENPLTGDVIHGRGADRGDASTYRVILSPSCDLVRGRNIPSVLVAKCFTPEAMVRSLSPPKKEAEAVDRIRKVVLSQGHWNGYLPLPEFPAMIPLLVADLRDLEVIQYSDINPNAGTEPRYERIASIDSPFRELISWAFLSTVARPGLPERDLVPWAERIRKATS